MRNVSASPCVCAQLSRYEAHTSLIRFSRLICSSELWEESVKKSAQRALEHGVELLLKFSFIKGPVCTIFKGSVGIKWN